MLIQTGGVTNAATGACRFIHFCRRAEQNGGVRAGPGAGTGAFRWPEKLGEYPVFPMNTTLTWLGLVSHISRHEGFTTA